MKKKITYVVCMIVLSHTTLPANTKDSTEKHIFDGMRIFSKVCARMQNSLRPVNVEKVIEAAIKSMVAGIDPHSSIVHYKNTIESVSGKICGIGVNITGKELEDDMLNIVDVVPGGPAQKAGILPGDKIVEVDSKKVKGISTDEVISLLKGKPKTIVNVKIVREKKPLEYCLKREIIKDQTSTCYYIPSYDTYYIFLKTFSENSAADLKKCLLHAHKKDHKGIILDLRKNTGGVLEAAIDVAGLFLPQGSSVVVTKNRQHETIKTYSTVQSPILNTTTPLFILTDNFTASAAEIVAGALRYHSEHTNLKVFLVGTETFGKGTVQEVSPINVGEQVYALKLTTMAYYLPDNTSIQAEGICPDFIVQPKQTFEKESKWIRELYGKEKALTNHITLAEVMNTPEKKTESPHQNNQEKPWEEKSWEEKQQDLLNKDTQLRSCLNLINLLHLGKQSNPGLVATRTQALAYLKKHFADDSHLSLQKIL